MASLVTLCSETPKNLAPGYLGTLAILESN